MNILKIEKGEHEVIHTDIKPEGCGIYRRIVIEGEFPTFSWEHSIDRNGGTWLRLFDHEEFENVYQKYIKEHPQESNDKGNRKSRSANQNP